MRGGFPLDLVASILSDVTYFQRSLFGRRRLQADPFLNRSQFQHPWSSRFSIKTARAEKKDKPGGLRLPVWDFYLNDWRPF
jgi:hypothetical protein